MKQLLFLLLFPCLAIAQYQGNGNQKITLGEQTTADGLVYRGLAADTTRKPSVDTMAFILLDTNTNIIWQYKKATNNAWTRVGGSISSGLTGVLPVANGGTNTNTLTANKVMVGNGTSGVLTPTNLHWDNTNSRFGIQNSSPQFPLDIGDSLSAQGLKIVCTNRSLLDGAFAEIQTRNGNGEGDVDAFRISTMGKNFTSILGYIKNSAVLSSGQNLIGGINFFTRASAPINFYTNNSGISRLTISSDGNVGIGTTSPAVQFHTTGGVRFAGLASITDLRTDASGNLFNGSDFNLKNSIDTINFGLSDVLKLKPVSFNWNDEQRNINEYKSMGFIAQDVMNIIPNAASTMGDGDMQVDYNAIVATLTKAIQEQNALIKALEQRILTLENK